MKSPALTSKFARAIIATALKNIGGGMGGEIRLIAILAV
jgi:hypothetical protein